ncbi:MAG: hypothetical protein AB8E15_12915 [Bdellovibrionales bacterium]
MKKIILTAVVFMSAQISQAGIYLEPYIGTSFQSLESGTIPAGDLSGETIGARIGYSIPLFTAALDITTGSPKAELSGTNNSADLMRTGVTLIFAPPILPFNVLAGYYRANLDVGSPVNTDYSGDGTKIGVMFTMLPIVNINVEYFNTNYGADSLKDKGLVVGVSADFEL